MFRSGPAPAARSPLQDSSASLVKTLRTPLFASLLLGLAACGGGGGGGGTFDGGGLPSGSLNTQPVYGIGKGSGTNYQDGVIDASQTTLRAGETATLRINTVVTNRNNEPPSDPPSTLVVNFSSACAAAGRATFGTPVNVSPGLSSVSYTNNGCDGEDTVTFTLSGAGPTDTASVKMTMVGPEVLTVSFVEATHDQLTLAGIGGNESTEVTFKVAGPQGVPIIGKRVDFSLNTAVGGASILAGRESGITDQQGNVRTVINSGTVAGPVSVRAVHAESGKQGSSSDIVISTGVPVANRFSMSWTPFNPVGAWNTDGVTVTINIIASDAFGNNPTDGTRISFVAPESGNVQNSCLLVNGACSVTWRSTSPRPRDGRAEVIAYTDGAENFVDTNGNSLFDSADGAILDMGEPYADENENGVYNNGEFFFDTNRNGARDAGNGRWDGPCLNKVNPAAVCNGNNTVSIYDTITIVMPTDFVRIISRGSFPAPGNTITIQQGTSLLLSGMVVADTNDAADVLGGNPPPIGTTITYAVQGAGVTLQGLTSYNVPNALSPIGGLGTTLVAAADTDGTLPTGISLLMTVQVPGRSQQQFVWPVVIAQ